MSAEEETPVQQTSLWNVRRKMQGQSSTNEWIVRTPTVRNL